MGAGKSTVGRIVAKGMGRIFIDTDVHMQRTYGPAADILSKPDGDDQFRKLEERIAVELARDL